MKSSHLQNGVSLLTRLQRHQLQLIIDRENVVKVYQGVPGFLMVWYMQKGRDSVYYLCVMTSEFFLQRLLDYKVSLYVFFIICFHILILILL